MGTPFDATAGAVGIVSLGITVCQGIIKYYQKYESFVDDMEDACKKIELLEKTLEDIKKKLQQDFLSQSQKHVIELRVIACKDGIELLDRTHKKMQKGPPWAQKLVYPFKERSMSKGLTRVTELEQSLATASLGLTIDIFEVASASKKRIDAMAEDYSDGLSELAGTLTTITSIANAKKISSKLSQQKRQGALTSLLGTGVRNHYNNIAAFLIYRDCRVAVGRKDPSVEISDLETLLCNKFTCHSTPKRCIVPGIDQSDPWRVRTQIRKGLSDLLWPEESEDTLLFILYSGFHDVSSKLGVRSTKDKDTLKLRNHAQLDAIVREEVETFLQLSEKSDVLTIFDCYYSGKLEGQNFDSIIKPPLSFRSTRILGRKLEFLGSIMSERRATDSRSLTSACTWALDKLADDSPDGFTVQDIYVKIFDAPDFDPPETILFPGYPGSAMPAQLRNKGVSPLHPALLPCGAVAIAALSSLVTTRAMSPMPRQSNEES